MCSGMDIEHELSRGEGPIFIGRVHLMKGSGTRDGCGISILRDLILQGRAGSERSCSRRLKKKYLVQRINEPKTLQSELVTRH